jgi:CO/xanthine dehydrogenase Mo-binding subunit
MVEEGRVLNPNFADYSLPTSLDMPEIESFLIETDDPAGPFGAKGMAEPACIPTAPAIANAVFDAVGVRIRDLPITPEKVLKALREKEAQEEEER